MKFPAHHWTYPARLIRVYDGDTVTMTIDRGMRDYTEAGVRLYEVFAPEVVGPEKPEGLKSKAYTVQWFKDNTGPQDWPFHLATRKADASEKYGRVLAFIFSVQTRRCLNVDIVAAGFATKEQHPHA